MEQLSLHSNLHKFATCEEFVAEFQIGKEDLIITCEYIYQPFFGALGLEAQVVYQEKYGQGEPSDEMILGMLADVKPGFKRVIGIGGGTVLDISKLFALKSITPLLDLFQGKIPAEKGHELLLVPTTCGTGSEVTNVAIVGFPALDTKLRLAVDAMYADDAILIPELLKNLPRKFFATSSIDALIHAIESSLSPLATEYSLMFGYQAIAKIVKAYCRMEKEGFDILPGLLSDFMLASNYAGIAFGKAGCGAAHAMSYPFGGKYHVAHGEANYVLLSSVLKMYAQKSCIHNFHDTMEVLAEALGLPFHGEEDVLPVVLRLEELLSVILEKKPMSAYGTKQEELPDFADSVLKYQAVIMSHNPVVLSREDVIAIYEDALN